MGTTALTGIFVLAASTLITGLGTAAYLTAAVAAAISSAHAGTRRVFWRSIGAVQLAFAADAAFGIHTAITGQGRTLAREQGLYDGRRPAQAIAAVIMLMLVTVVTALIMRWLAREKNLGCRFCQISLLGTSSSLAMLLLLIISFHYTDSVIDWPSPAMNVELVVRGAGALMAVTGAGMYFGWKNRQQ